MRVLLIEDSQRLMATVVDYLELEGIECDCAYDGRQALARVRESAFDVVVADIMMARMDGISAVREMRETLGLEVPVLFLTARDTLEDKQAAFAAGGDDYLTKPFAMQELTLRIAALARRAGRGRVDGEREFGGLRSERGGERIAWRGRALRLGRLQRRILAALLERAPALVTREALVEALWGAEAPASDALRSHVYALRRALEDAGVELALETVHGEGYRLVR